MPGYMGFKRMQYYCNRPHTWNTTFKHSNLKHIRKFLDSYHERNLYYTMIYNMSTLILKNHEINRDLRYLFGKVVLLSKTRNLINDILSNNTPSVL